MKFTWTLSESLLLQGFNKLAPQALSSSCHFFFRCRDIVQTKQIPMDNRHSIRCLQDFVKRMHTTMYIPRCLQEGAIAENLNHKSSIHPIPSHFSSSFHPLHHHWNHPLSSSSQVTHICAGLQSLLIFVTNTIHRIGRPTFHSSPSSAPGTSTSSMTATAAEGFIHPPAVTILPPVHKTENGLSKVTAEWARREQKRLPR